MVNNDIELIIHAFLFAFRQCLIFKNNFMNHKTLTFFCLALLFSACKTEPVDSFTSLNLMKYGMPITIMAPDSADVKTDDLIVMQEVSVRSGEDYFVQIYSSDATTADLAVVKEKELMDAKKAPFFSKIVLDEPNGFIFESQLDSTHLSYGFRLVKIQGDKEYVFRNGMIGLFAKEDIEAMYQGVKKNN